MRKLTFILFLLFIISCNSTSNYVEDFGAFINDIELNSETFSDEDWEYNDVTFNDFSSIKFMTYKNQLTESEINQIESFRKRYNKLKMKNNPTDEIGKGILNQYFNFYEKNISNHIFYFYMVRNF